MLLGDDGQAAGVVGQADAALTVFITMGAQRAVRQLDVVLKQGGRNPRAVVTRT